MDQTDPCFNSGSPFGIINSDMIESGPVFSGTTSNNSDDKQSIDERSYASHPRSQPNRTVRGGATSSRPSNRRTSRDGADAKVNLDDVRPIWLDTPNAAEGDPPRYLLLEDQETGDVLMPLIYMKRVLEANYSRKLSSMKHRLVSVPADAKWAGPRKATQHLCWKWAFESPQTVKLVVRKELGEDGFPQGHLRLVLLPIVYNAMCQKAHLRQHPLYQRLRAAMKASAYWPLLNQVPESSNPSQPQGDLRDMLFRGPKMLEETCMKYMMPVGDGTESEGGGKRSRQQYQTSQDAAVQGGLSGGSQPDAALMDLKDDFTRYKRESEMTIAALQSELATIKGCMYQVYSVLGSQPPMLQAHPVTPGVATPSQPLLRPSHIGRRTNSSTDLGSDFMSTPGGGLDAHPVVCAAFPSMHTPIVGDGSGVPVTVSAAAFPPPGPMMLPHEGAAYVQQQPQGPMHPFPFPGPIPVAPPVLQAGLSGVLPGTLSHIPGLPVGPPPGHPMRFSGPPNIVSTTSLLQMGQQLSMSHGIPPPGSFYAQTAYATPPGPSRGM